MKFDTWVYHTTGSTWEELGGMSMPADQRHRLYDDYEEYCFGLGIPFDLSASKVKKPTMAQADTFEFEDIESNSVKVEKVEQEVEIQFLTFLQAQPSCMNFDERHLPYFRRIVEMLENCCSHSESETVAISGTDETITVCAQCGREL